MYINDVFDDLIWQFFPFAASYVTLFSEKTEFHQRSGSQSIAGK